MAGDEDMCCSCFSKTKYTCLACGNYFCMRCSVFENDEETPGWKEGKSVGYCEPCFDETMKRRESTRQDDAVEKQENIKPNQPNSSSNGTETKTKRVKNADDIDEQDIATDEEDDDRAEEDDLQLKKSKGKGKAGRRPKWSSDDVDDMVDIVVSSEYYKKKLIFTNTKNQRNGEIYERIQQEMQQRAKERNSEFKFSISQMRTKFKKCIGDCKTAAMTIKTATGIKRFQENQGYGKWFPSLFAIVKTRESCQPEQAIEPSSSSPSPVDKGSDDDRESTASAETDMFIPIKRAKKEKKKNQFDTAFAETLEIVKEVVKNDPTKDLINFMREEMDKAREHELKLFQLLHSSRPNGSNGLSIYDQQGNSGLSIYDQHGNSGMYQRQSGINGSQTPGSGMYQSMYNQWY